MTIEEQNFYEQRKAFVYRLENKLPPFFSLPEYFSRRYVADKELAKVVVVYVLPLFEGFGNGKMAPAFQILLDIEEETRGRFPKVLVVPSSGNTVANMAHQVQWVRPDARVLAVLEQSVPAGKIGQILKASENVEIMRVAPGESTIEVARGLAEKHGYYFVDQYKAKGSLGGHLKYTWPHVVRQFQGMGIVPSFGCLALGTTSAFVSAHCLQATWPNFQVVGTACCPDEVIPGARTVKKLEATGFGYEKMIGDRLVLCPSRAAEDMSDALYRYASFSAGPTTGMAVEAAFQFVNQRGWSLVNEEGQIPVLTLGMDAAAPYYADYASRRM